jgi:hypothetical protein
MVYRSALMTTGSGSIGGITILRSRLYNLIARSRVKPVVTRSNFQSTIRTLFNNAAIAWKSLDRANRLAWDNYAAGTPYTNRLGDTIYNTGRNLYISVRSFIQYCLPTVGEENFLMPADIPGWLEAPLVDLDTATEVTLAIRVTNVANVPMRFLLRISGPHSPSSTRPPVGSVPDNAYRSTTIPHGGTFTATFSDLVPATRYNFICRGWRYDVPNQLTQNTTLIADTNEPV